MNFITDFINKNVKEEWDSKLCDITDHKDLAQCMVILVNFITDCRNKNCKERVGFQIL